MKSSVIRWYFLIIFPFYDSIGQSLIINEIMSSNHSVIMDEDGDFEDWIELYNSANTSINLLNFAITDNPERPNKWTFPSLIVPPNSYILIFASGKNRKSGTNLHTNFKISASGEPIILSNPFGTEIDRFEEKAIPTNHSYGRKTDGAAEKVLFSQSTPGYSNDGAQFIALEELSFSHTSGFYSSPFKLEISSENPEVSIYYTLDGSPPSTSSHVFNEAILITDRSLEPNGISEIRTNPDAEVFTWQWKLPKEEISKATTIKARAFLDNEPQSHEYTSTYFVYPEGANKYTLPVISITTHPENLFNYDTGIYVHGKHHDMNPSWGWFFGTGNYHQRGVEWERTAYMEYFEPDGSVAISQNVGIRIHGLGSRALPQKSLRIYARNIYGSNTFDYQFFKNRDFKDYKRIVLRNSGQDFLNTMFKDGLTGVLIDTLNIEYQLYQPSIVFINGEYWGIHNIRDRMDENFLSYSKGADHGNIDMLDNRDEIMYGSNENFKNLLQFIEENDLQISSNYNYVAEEIDLNNFMDYWISKQYLATYDWPGNNIRFWRSTEPKSKWRWIFFDNDDALFYPEFNSIEHTTFEGNVNYPNPLWSTFLFRNLLRNNTFKEAYINRADHLLEHIFSPARVISKIDSLKKLIEPEIDEHISRWGWPDSREEWEWYVEMMKEFAKKRPCFMRTHLFDYFNLNDDPRFQKYTDKDCNTIITEIETNSLVIYPNPNAGNFYLQLHSPNKQLMPFKLFNALGAIVQESNINLDEGINDCSIQIDNVLPGVYFLHFTIGNNNEVKKIIIH
ncbi:MAG: CotH kinase family protein [Cytophagaceae bacterium]